ncbi:MAG TPA: ATP-binding protein [Tepidisphaeraceae bacterium]|jgi:signal transduction histidine kinase
MSAARLLTVDVRFEQDVVQVRQRTRQIAALVGLSTQDQTGFATAVSEIVRNAFRYAGGGRVEFLLHLDASPQVLTLRVVDRGPGIADLNAVLSGQYASTSGAGMGIVGSQRLCDAFDIDSAPGRGTTVTLSKRLPRRSGPLTRESLSGISAELARRGPQGPLEEVQAQNKELLHAMEELRARQSEVERLNAELAETNRGVVALYAELDDRAEAMRKASEYKSRFLSDMTHELRTPLNAVISLARLLIDRADGDLLPEQEKQVRLIHRSAVSLGDMIDDLLDLAKIEAGKTDVYAASFNLSDTLAALRGIFRPLLRDGVQLNVAEPVGLTELRTDERKLSQILRNLVSNALKFTESGCVDVSTETGPDGTVIFRVTDTGIGIAAENLERIFDDFTQIDSGVQRRLRGTGLGLPLTRKLARLLGGDVVVRSNVGVGTIFTVTLPAELSDCGNGPATQHAYDAGTRVRGEQ